jgi:anti-sigma-K factor RskA
MDGKWLRYFIARPGAVAGKVDLREIDPEDPATRDVLADETVAGKVRVENDDQIWNVFSVDEATHELVDRTFKDIVALAQEHMIPHKPFDPEAES